MDANQLPPRDETAGHLEQIVPRDEENVPDDYFKSRLFIGTTSALAISLVCGNGAFSLAAPILDVINNDIGPDPNYVWIGLVITLMLACGTTVVGRLSDLCGRRYFFTAGNFLGLIGAVICSRATSIPNLIGGNVFLGLAASVQTSIPMVMGELVPMKHRFIVTGCLFTFAIPFAVFGPAISYALVTHTQAGWRWIYYMLIITNTCATLLWFFFYHPPTFVMVTRKSRWQMIKQFDYIGFVLVIGGLLVFMMGLSWGGSVHPWNSGYVIGCIVVGALSLVSFVIYEAKSNLPDPIVPLHLFRNIGWVVTVLIAALAASGFYAFSVVFPQMVFGVWTNDPTYGSILACAGSGGFLLGLILSGLARWLGPIKLQILVASCICSPLMGAVACATVDNKSTVLALFIVGSIFCGYVEGVAVTAASLALHNQAEIGTAVGVGFTLRGVCATIATTIYVVVLSNRLATTIPALVPPALVEAGLPASSVPGFLQGITTGSFDGVSGLTPAILAIGLMAYKEAQVQAFRTVFLSSIAFTGTIIVLALLIPDLSSKMTNQVGALLRDKKERQKVIQDIEARQHQESDEGDTAEKDSKST